MSQSSRRRRRCTLDAPQLRSQDGVEPQIKKQTSAMCLKYGGLVPYCWFEVLSSNKNKNVCTTQTSRPHGCTTMMMPPYLHQLALGNQPMTMSGQKSAINFTSHLVALIHACIGVFGDKVCGYVVREKKSNAPRKLYDKGDKELTAVYIYDA